MSSGFVNFLAKEYQRRKKKNPRYSLRAYASSLGISSGRLSEFMSGKRQPGLSTIEKFIDLMATSEEARMKLRREFVAPKRQTLVKEDQLRLIKDWYHVAILSLMEIDDFHPDPAWIAKRLGITSQETQKALDRLIRVGLIEVDKSSGHERWHLSQASTTTTHDVPSSALRESHRQTLVQTMRALEEVSVEMRDITSLTMAIDIDKIPQAKKEIRIFRRKLCRLLESGQKKEVFNLNIQLVPVTRL